MFETETEKKHSKTLKLKQGIHLPQVTSNIFMLYVRYTYTWNFLMNIKETKLSSNLFSILFQSMSYMREHKLFFFFVI